MQIKDMFRKKIDREIQGVIIVGQGEETNVAQELEEYVVTRELQRHFADFFAAYKKGIQGTTPKMGVWISGFFGSGKSHFLKILSYLLQNKQVGDKHAIDYFIEDQKITNQMVLADMQLAANTPSDVILFNIDSKSDSNGKENKDAIVNVFLKVFNEMQGFCGSMPHLADLERRLSEEGRFEEFKEKFEEEYGDPWESSRQDFDFIQDSVVDVLSDMDFMSESAARNWCEKATEGYQISIEDFAKRVMPHIDIEEVREGRKAFTQEEWMDVMLRSCGYEPEQLNNREKWLLLARMLPLVENNFNLCELGPRSTGKSHIYKEISPNSILVSGGQTTVANLFYNMGRKTVGLVGLWDCVAFDEVAGIKFKDKDGIQIMKDYMASGSFARGKEEKAASASMVFVGNINQSVDVLLKTSSLFDPFPPEMGTDTAFLDRLHCYIPGWEIPKFRPEHFTNDYGFITDYLAEFIRELRKEQYGDALDKYFRLGKNLNQRDTIAVRKIVGGYVKLLYPDGEFTKEQIEEILVFALEMRRRVKEQLKKLGGMEFYDVNFSYIDLDTFEEKFVSVPEQGGGKLIPDGICNPGQVYTVSQGKSGMIGVFRLESQMLPGNGKFERTGLGSDRDCKESTNTAFNFLKANGNRISGSISTTMRDYIINYQDLQGIGMTGKLALPTLIALCSIALGRPTVSTLAVLGEISISGTILKVDELANSLQVCLDSGAKKVLLPITSAADLGTVPPELVGSFNLIFYSSAEDAVFKALGVE